MKTPMTPEKRQERRRYFLGKCVGIALAMLFFSCILGLATPAIVQNYMRWKGTWVEPKPALWHATLFDQHGEPIRELSGIQYIFTNRSLTHQELPQTDFLRQDGSRISWTGNYETTRESYADPRLDANYCKMVSLLFK